MCRRRSEPGVRERSVSNAHPQWPSSEVSLTPSRSVQVPFPLSPAPQPCRRTPYSLVTGGGYALARLQAVGWRPRNPRAYITDDGALRLKAQRYMAEMEHM